MSRVLRRLVWAVFVVWAAVTLAFVVDHALPSDPGRMIAGQQAPPAAVAKIRRDLGLDRPLYVQYGRFLGRLVHVGPPDDGKKPAPTDPHVDCGRLGPIHVDLGRSYQQRRPVVRILTERAPRTLLLAFAAACVQALLGVAAGVLAAARKKTAIDYATVTASLLGVSAPTFLLGLLLQWLVAVRFGALPIDGYGETTTEHLRCLVLPALTLGIFGAAYYTRVVRDEMIVELGRDYVRTARAKGLGSVAVLVRHALRNAAIPIATMFGLEVGTLVGGAVVTESVFRWPGIGSLSVTAALDHDGPVIIGCVIVTSVAVVVSNVVVDFAYALLDPRVRRAQ